MAEEFARIVTGQARFTGIQAYITLPATSSISLPNDYDLVDFYIGLANAVEAGVSYSRKGEATESWRHFINHGAGSPGSVKFSPGSKVHLKLTNDGNNTVSFYLNGALVFSGQASNFIGSRSTVKQVCGAIDQGGANDVTHGQATFSQVLVRPSGGSWISWADNIGTIGHDPTVTARYKGHVTSHVPLQCELPL